jgi:hypothetical protein
MRLVEHILHEAAARAVLFAFGMTEKVLDDSFKLLPQLGAKSAIEVYAARCAATRVARKGFRACARNAVRCHPMTKIMD